MSAGYNILKLAPLNPILLRVVTAGGRRLRHAFTRWGYLGLLMVVLLIALVVPAHREHSPCQILRKHRLKSSALSRIRSWA